MEGSVLSFLKAEWKVSDTGASSYYFNTTWVIYSFFKGKQSTCQVLNMAAF